MAAHRQDGIANLFFRRPRLTVLAIGLIVIAGMAALGSLPRQEDPILTGRFGRVLTFYPGASAERVEALVTEKIEKRLQEVEEITEINSRSRPNVSYVGIQLKDESTKADVDEIWSRVRDKLADVTPELPDGVGVPEFKKLTTSAWTVLIGFTWDQNGPPQIDLLHRLAKDLEQLLIPLAGTMETNLFGEPEEEIQVTIEAAALAAANLTTDEISRAIAMADTKVPAGQVRGLRNNLVIEVGGELDSVQRIRSIPLSTDANGVLLRVGDIADVSQAPKDPPSTMALISGKRGIVLAVKMEGDFRVDEWTARVRNAYDAFAASVPRGVRVEFLFDQSVYTAERLDSLTDNLLLGAVLVVIVLFLMFGWKAALLVSSALPLTLLAVLALLKVIEVPLHQISITGLIIALGLLIDNAIVAVDDYQKARREGLPPGEAISAIVGHLFVPLLASTLTTLLTFLPLVIMPGNAGEFVSTLGISVILSIICSLFLSLTIIPALAGFFDRRAKDGLPRRFWRDGVGHPLLAAGYRSALDFVLRRPFVGIGLALIPPILGFAMAGQLVQQFFPHIDRDQFVIQLKLPALASIDETLANVRKAREILAGHEEVLDSHWFLGENPPRVFYNTTIHQLGVQSFAAGFVVTRGPEATKGLLNRLQHQMIREFPNAMVLTLPFEQGPPVEAPVAVEIYGPEIHVLNQIGEQVRHILQQSRNVTYTTSTVSGGLPKLRISPDEYEANLAGIRLTDLAGQLNAALEGVTGGSVLEGTEELPVRVRVTGADRSELARIAASVLLSPGRDGAALDADLAGVPLSAVTRMRLEPETASIARIQSERVNTVQAFLEPFVLPAHTVDDFTRRMEASDFSLPAGYRIQYGGAKKEREDSQSNLFGVFAPLLVLMVGTIIVTFNSFRLASIIFAVALQSVGLALLTIWIFGYPMGFMAIIGTMGLIGLAINDSIVVLAALNADEDARAGDAGRIRDIVVEGTRHIIATTLTTIGGFLPLVVFGGLFWPPLAMAVAGGMVGATILALIFVPSVFVLIVRRRARKAALVAEVS